MRIKNTFPLFVLFFAAAFGTSSCEAQNNQQPSEKSDTIKAVSAPQKKPIDFRIYSNALAAIADTSNIRRFEEEIIKFETEDSVSGFPKNAYLFIGSSSIRKWHSLQENMKPLQVINRGFGGSTMAEAIYYFPRIVKKYEPEAIILYEGDNDLSADNLQPEDFFELFKLFTEIRDAYLPNSKLYFLSIKPSPARLQHLEKMMKANELIRKHSLQHDDIFYIDISSDMFDADKKIRDELFLKDRLHLNALGYKLWKDIVRDLLISE